jgi:hypothetical protein
MGRIVVWNVGRDACGVCGTGAAFIDIDEGLSFRQTAAADADCVCVCR